MAGESGMVVILGTGGTIAGTAARAGDDVGYSAAQIGVRQLVAAVPPLQGLPLEVVQVAQVDSKDMTHALWCRLARSAQAHLERPQVAGIVITHGTDTLEETAYLLHRVLRTAKPVVLTAAMRPATSLHADGPQNLLDAVTVARLAAAGGVVVVMGGQVLAGCELRKVDSYRIDAFGSGRAGALAVLEEGRLRGFRAWPQADGLGVEMLPGDDADWPWVEIVSSHAGADGRGVDALLAVGVRGIVVAATGNGTLHRELQPALLRAQAAGVPVLRATRCAFGGIVGDAASAFPGAGGLTPAQARIELLLRLLGQAAH